MGGCQKKLGAGLTNKRITCKSDQNCKNKAQTLRRYVLMRFLLTTSELDSEFTLLSYKVNPKIPAHKTYIPTTPLIFPIDAHLFDGNRLDL